MTDSEALTEARVREIREQKEGIFVDADELQALCTLALSALGTAPAEPVAWMVTRPGNNGSVFPKVYLHEHAADAMVEYVTVNPPAAKIPLYASPAPATAAEIRAKALEEAARAGGDTLLPKHPILAQMVRNAIRALSEAPDGH